MIFGRAARAIVRPAAARGAAWRWKGGGGASSGGPSSSSRRRTRRVFYPKPGYRLCRVCRIEDHCFTVREGQLCGAAVACEQKGVMCDRATKHYRAAILDVLMMGPVFVAAVFLVAMTNVDSEEEREARRERQQRMRAMRDDSAVAAEAMRAWCDHGNDEGDGNQDPLFVSRMAATGTLSGAWTAHYTERGSKGTSAYSLEFALGDQDAGTSIDTIFFQGLGKDCDGPFAIEGGRFNMSTRRLAWGERSQNSSLFARCRMKCANEDCTELRGDYLATTGITGDLTMEWKAKNEIVGKHDGLDRLPVSDVGWV